MADFVGEGCCMRMFVGVRGTRKQVAHGIVWHGMHDSPTACACDAHKRGSAGPRRVLMIQKSGKCPASQSARRKAPIDRSPPFMCLRLALLACSSRTPLGTTSWHEGSRERDAVRAHWSEALGSAVSTMEQV